MWPFLHLIHLQLNVTAFDMMASTGTPVLVDPNSLLKPVGGAVPVSASQLRTVWSLAPVPVPNPAAMGEEDPWHRPSGRYFDSRREKGKTAQCGAGQTPDLTGTCHPLSRAPVTVNFSTPEPCQMAES